MKRREHDWTEFEEEEEFAGIHPPSPGGPRYRYDTLQEDTVGMYVVDRGQQEKTLDRKWVTITGY